MKKQAVLIIVAVLIVAVGVYLWQSKASKPSSNSQVAGYEAKTNEIPTNNTLGEGAGTESKSLIKATLAEVATHNKITDCWAVVDKNVYDLTAWISKHPGGEAAIISLCGIDGTEAFTRKHGSSDKAKAALASLLIGNLVE